MDTRKQVKGEAKEYAYLAFISHNSKDAHIAKRLKRSLSSYRLPSTVRKQKGLAKKLPDIFRFQDDLTVDETLKQALFAKLEKSKYLIVVCTPHSAKSEWCGIEIEYFLTHGRKDKIILYIAEGEPYSENPETECFNKEILKAFPKTHDGEALGLTVNKRGFFHKHVEWERLVVKIISKMLQLEVNTLWQEQKRRMLMQIVRNICLFLAFLATLLFVVEASAPLELRLRLKETGFSNPHLPPLEKIAVELRCDDWHARDTFADMNSQIIIRNIPSKLRHKEITLSLDGDYMNAAQSTLTLSAGRLSNKQESTIAVSRDSLLFGRLKIRITDKQDRPLLDTPLTLNDSIRRCTDQNGILDTYIPLPQQQDTYLIRSIDEKQNLLYGIDFDSEGINLELE